MKYFLLAFLLVSGCKHQSDSYLVGKWKVITKDRSGQSSVFTTMEFTEQSYIIPGRGNRRDTFDYILKGDTLVTSRFGEEEDISLIQRINDDTARVKVMSLPITFLIVREK